MEIILLKEGCQSCDCVGDLTHASGVYGITIGGDRKLVYCSFENELSWTVSILLLRSDLVALNIFKKINAWCIELFYENKISLSLYEHNVYN